MMIRTVSLLSMLAVAGMAHAQVHVYTEQNVDGKVEKVAQLGTAVFGTQYTTPTISFVNGKAVMTIGNTTVASVPVSNGGVMVVDCCAFDEADGAHDAMNKINKSPSVTDKRPYVTLFSPFQVVVPEGCEVYAPEFYSSTETLLLTNTNKLSAGDVVPVETPLVVKGDKSVDFTFSANHATCVPESALSGTSLRISTPTDCTVFTFGHDKTDSSLYGLFRYVAGTLPPGVAYLKAAAGATSTNYIPVALDDSETTGIRQQNTLQTAVTTTKFAENGRIVICRGNKKYNINGQIIK